MIRTVLLTATALAIAAPAATQDLADPAVHSPDLYRITMIRAAPGQWYEAKAIIEGLGEQGTTAADGCAIPFRLRHNQGAQWDFMLLQPVGSYADYFAKSCEASEWCTALEAHADHESDWFARGPAVAEMKARVSASGLYLLEMFKARAEMKPELYDSRARENAIFQEFDMATNTLWYGEMGADFDVMTIGTFANWPAFGAHMSTGTAEEWDARARTHGYDGSGDMSPQLRSFLTGHEDTFAVKMK
ncbi:hypothetical protein [Sphingomicrobium arenosum]|uniref:hypothetical protein n=1 Tax=Sphingomicrobium arenosum TaxID=2233861 RepID=UPI002240420D|nr:hypothetical protein [Sphingomicrobium arenosum]